MELENMTTVSGGNYVNVERDITEIEEFDYESSVKQDYSNFDYQRSLFDLDKLRLEADNFKNITSTKSEVVKTLITALGTMVQYPEYTTDPNQIGKKDFKMYIQRPILEGENREVTLDRLMDIIKSI